MPDERADEPIGQEEPRIRLEPTWVNPRAVLALHDRQLAEHGGGVGLRDAGALDSALARPRNRWEYGEDDRAALAAAYAFGIARNHPFVDGNKRTAWVVARLFFRLNGETLRYMRKEAIDIVLALAAGELSEEELANWFRERLTEA
jgi:death-on-curing protein